MMGFADKKLLKRILCCAFILYTSDFSQRALIYILSIIIYLNEKYKTMRLLSFND